MGNGFFQSVRALLRLKPAQKLNRDYLISLLCAVLLAFLVGAGIMLLCGFDPIQCYGALFEGALGKPRAIGNTLAKATTLALCGLAMSVAAKAGIFNVGGEGQLFMGALAAAVVGAQVKGAGTDVIRITGGRRLHGCTYPIIPDQIEAGTYMIAAAATGGDVVINNIIPTHLEAISAKLMESGAHVVDGDDGREFFMRVSCENRPRAVNIKTLPYPGFPTDLQQPMMAYLTKAKGNSFIVENIFENRFNHVGELQRMGANIVINDRTAMVEGVEKLFGAPLYASDLRAGAALIVAALSAEGRSEIHNIEYIDRGYEYFEQKLRALGADITRGEE